LQQLLQHKYLSTLADRRFDFDRTAATIFSTSFRKFPFSVRVPGTNNRYGEQR